MKIVIALGGNALGNNPKEQLKLVGETAKSIVDLISLGHEVVITHGNGPQVGMINLALNDMPFAECGAMSQGYIGYHLQQSIQNELFKRKINKNCVTVISQVLVDKDDSAFNNPTKPIGPFYTKEEALEIMAKTSYTILEDAGRGYRRVIASPKPVKILELETIYNLINCGDVVIALGGGGIPVIYDGVYKGIDAVIDKDKTSSKLAIDIKADMLLILTTVSKVSINYNKENEIKLDSLTVSDALKYISNNEFAKGSMLPKIEACIDFVMNSNGKAIITSLENAKDALLGQTGTVILKGGN